MKNHKTLKLKGREYDSHCRDCLFSESGDTYNTVVKAKKHAEINNHSVEYYVQSGKVYKLTTGVNK